MRLLVLGGGSGQISLIKKAQEMGYKVIVSDYYQDAPAKKIADFSSNSSTFDIKANLKTADNYQAEGILTAGTDQPVYTAAVVAEQLDLNKYISVSTAKAVTNKKLMKKKFNQGKIATVKYQVLKKDFKEKKLKHFSRPFVVKPLDSQGQRGVFKLNSIKEIRKKFDEVLSFSREDEILIEEYYPSDEITISGWVKDAKAKILTVTDRISFEENIHIGICSAHIFPSKYLKKYGAEIEKLSQKIVDVFSIKNGPIYFQFLIGKQGIKVNEIAARIGGAYEGEFMPMLTGVDIFKMMIKLAAGEKIDYRNLDNYFLSRNNKYLSSQLFFAKSAVIDEIASLSKIKQIPGLLKFGLNYSQGDKIPSIKNATARAGHFVVLAADKKQLQQKIDKVYNNLKVLDTKGRNLILKPQNKYFN